MSDAQSSQKGPLVIIGSGLAGYGLVRELRRHDPDRRVIVLTSDDGAFYNKPLLSTGYTKNMEADALAVQSAADFAAQTQSEVRTEVHVASIDVAAKALSLSDGSTLQYGDLVLTLGAELICPPLEGDATADVLGVNDLDDYRRFRAAVREADAKKIAIIGAGLIGCEYTNDLLNGGYTTEVVDPMGWCLPTLLPEQPGRAVQAALESKGARFHFGALATAVDHAENGYRVTLNNGGAIEADLVLCAVGVRPRTALAADAGIETRRGIVTNRLLETSAPSVYAFGDCAEVDGHVLVYVAPLMAAARALAATLAGTPTEVMYPAMPVTIKTPACPVVVSPPPRDAEGNWTITGDAPDLQCEFHGEDGALLGFALTGSTVRGRMALQKQLPAILD